MDRNEEMQMAYAFAAGEFLEEELEMLYLEGPLKEDDDFLKKGKCIINEESKHPYEWWAPAYSIDNLNSLYANQQRSPEGERSETIESAQKCGSE